MQHWEFRKVCVDKPVSVEHITSCVILRFIRVSLYIRTFLIKHLRILNMLLKADFRCI